MQIIQTPVASPNLALNEIILRADRLTLSKRLWRAVAEDGAEFGFDLVAPLKHGDTFFETSFNRYVVAQQPESVIEISLAIAPSAAAGIGWAVGNLHLELQAEASRLFALDEPAVRNLLARLNVPFTATTAIFRPGRFVRGDKPVHELGPSHQH